MKLNYFPPLKKLNKKESFHKTMTLLEITFSRKLIVLQM